jgi:rare lipoprotein A
MKKLAARALCAFLLLLPFHWAQAQTIDQVGFTQRGRASYFADDRGGVFTASGERYSMATLTAAHPFIAFNSYVRVTNLDNGRSVVVRINDRFESQERIIDLTKAAAEQIGAVGQLFTDVKIEIVPNPNAPKTAPAASTAGTNTASTAGAAASAAGAAASTAGAAASAAGAAASTAGAAASTAAKEIALEERFWKVGTYTPEGQAVKPLGYGVQIGWFSDAEAALELAQRFAGLQFGSLYIQSGWEKGQKAYRVLIGSFASEAEARPTVSFLNERQYHAFVRKHYGVQ